MTRELTKLITSFRCTGLVGWRVNSIIVNLVALVLLALAFGFGILHHFYGSERGGCSYTASLTRQGEKFLEVPQIIWGLNNQKIAFARACLTARLLNRTLLMPTFSAALFYKEKEVEVLQPIAFDKIFQFDRFNSLCRGFVQLGRISGSAKPLELVKGRGRRWTAERDLAQLNSHREAPYADYEIIRIKGKNPFLWHDHWPVKDYARVFGCLEFVDEIVDEAVQVISKIKAAGLIDARGGIGSGYPPQQQNVPYVAVHMRLEKDWMIHCRHLEKRMNVNQICSSKEEIVERVGKVPGMRNPSILYLAVADDLLEDGSVLSGWKEGILPLEKKGIGAWDVYSKHTYLIRSAIDFEVCSRAHIFVGNSFSTFSSLVVLERTQRLITMGVTESCGEDDSGFASYAYNILGDGGGPKKWMTNMADGSLHALSYGTINISCRSFFGS